MEAFPWLAQHVWSECGGVAGLLTAALTFFAWRWNRAEAECERLRDLLDKAYEHRQARADAMIDAMLATGNALNSAVAEIRGRLSAKGDDNC